MGSYDGGAEAQITYQLSPKERLLWSGRPRPGLQPNSKLLLLCAGLVLLVAGGFWIQQGRVLGGAAIGGPTGRIVMTMRLIQGISLLVPVLVLAVPAVLDLMVRSRTVYALTDRRVLIAGGLNGRRVTSLPLASLTEISLDVRADGSGTIGFGPERKQAAQALGYTWISPDSSHRLDRIDDVRAVHAHILEAQRALEIQRILEAQRLLAASSTT